jgi:mono/diheme cytochrome c family protein
MNKSRHVLLLPLLLTACTTEPTYNPLDDYEELDAATVLDAPTPAAAVVSPENREAVARGEYLVELLGCGSCHTDGALIGEPKMDRSLAGSRVGIAYTSPLATKNPGVVYAPNITPHPRTGIGSWSDEQIAIAVRAGLGRHWGRRIMVMPWQGYARMSDADAYAIVGYLRSIEPIDHQVPDNVEPGTMALEPYVHFGVYQSR